MPSGLYLRRDPESDDLLGQERFQCGPGPAGWRFVSRLTAPGGEPAGSVDLTIDELGRPLRLELNAAGWRVRGGALGGLTWVRMATAGGRAEGAQPPQEGNARASAFAGPSPAFLVAVARLLRLGPSRAPDRASDRASDRGPASVRLVDFTPPVLAPRTRDESWALVGSDVHDTDSGPLTVDHYRVHDLETGEGREVHLAGDVVLAAPGVELAELDSPPSSFPLRTGE